MMLITFLSMGLFLVPVIFNIDGMDGGFAIYFFAIFFTLTFAVGSLIFFLRSQRTDRVLQNTNLIGHFIYDHKAVRTIEDEKRADALLKKYLSIGLWILFTVIGLVVWLLSGDEEMMLFFGMMFGVGAFIFIFAQIATYKTLKKPVSNDAWFFNTGVIYDGEHTVFDGKTIELKKAFIKKEGHDQYLVIGIELPINRGFTRGPGEIEVLIPKYELEQAERIKKMYENIISKN